MKNQEQKIKVEFLRNTVANSKCVKKGQKAELDRGEALYLIGIKKAKRVGEPAAPSSISKAKLDATFEEKAKGAKKRGPKPKDKAADPVGDSADGESEQEDIAQGEGEVAGDENQESPAASGEQQ